MQPPGRQPCRSNGTLCEGGTAPRRSLLQLSSLFLSVLLIPHVLADCECGYSAVIGSDGAPSVFTDLIESDFTKIPDISQDTDWQRQAFNVSATDSRGTYGEMMDVDNVAGSSAGLELTVRGKVVDGMVSTAEVDTARLDVLWGTFRASMKLTSIPGTCAAFFWYYNNTQEIDIEALSEEFDPANNSYPINLVLQSRAAAEAGFNAQGTPTFKKLNLGFDPTADFHEYRFDFLPDSVYFYADGQVLAQLTGTAVPDHGGHLILQHWSNGNALWSGGPPAQDATLTVQYVKAYFNSSSPQRQSDWASRCPVTNGSSPGSVCAIPEVSSANVSNGSAAGAGGYFFSNQPNMTNNQTVFGENGAARGRELSWWGVLLVLSLQVLVMEVWVT